MNSQILNHKEDVRSWHGLWCHFSNSKHEKNVLQILTNNLTPGTWCLDYKDCMFGNRRAVVYIRNVEDFNLIKLLTL